MYSIRELLFHETGKYSRSKMNLKVILLKLMGHLQSTVWPIIFYSLSGLNNVVKLGS